MTDALTVNGHRLDVTDVATLIRVRGELGDKPLVIVGEETLTYAQANVRANRVASSLRELGVQRGDVVATYMENSIDHVCAWFACAKLGAIWAPLNIALVSLDLAHTLQDAAPKVLVVDDTLLPNVLGIPAFVDRSDTTIVVRGGDGRRDRPTFAQLALGDAIDPGVVLAPQDPAALVYTGGSTGMPKGVLVPHLWYFGGALRYREVFDPTTDDVHLGIGQLCHTLGSAVDVFAPMYHGMTSALTLRFSASRFWDVVRRRGATRSVLVGPLMTLLLRQPERADDADNPLRLAAAATGQITREVAQAFSERFAVELLEIYGQTETGPLGCVGQRRHDRPYHSVGKAYGWADVRVVRPDDRDCAPGEHGEIVLRPTHRHTFMLGYHGHPDPFPPGGDAWFHSGDLGHLDASGFLHFDGRQDHVIRRRGESISAAEVELALLLHPAVGECVVVGVPSDVGEEDVKVYVVPSGPLDPADLVRFLDGRIAYFKVPRYVELVTELPRSVTKGEVERHTLRSRGIGAAWDRERAGVLVGGKR